MKSWQERAEACIAQGACTYSKRNDQHIRGIYRTHVRTGYGPYLLMDDGRKMIDHTCGLGSNILSCCNNYGLPCTDEVEVAEMIKARFPFIDKLKFTKTGSAATQAAVRIARAYQQNKIFGTKDTIVFGNGIGYHGCDNWSIASEHPGMGTQCEGYFKSESLDKIIDHYKYFQDGVSKEYCIIEPVMLDLSVKDKLQELRDICTQKDIVLIFDEVITGFRTPKYCMANYFGIEPDIICLGKAIANGFPLSVVGGKAKYMDTSGYFISSTFAGEQTSLKMASMVMEALTEEKLLDLWTLGAWFQKEFNKLSERVQLYGIPTRAVWKGTEEDKAIFMQEMYRQGVLYGKAWWITHSHTKKLLEKELELARDVFQRMHAGTVMLEGQLPTEIFKRV